MKLYPPIKQTSVGTPRDLPTLIGMLSQGFGGNAVLYESLNLKGHNGIDWPCITGTPVYASNDGIATFSEDSDKGLGVVVSGPDFKTIYWHLESSPIPMGANVPVKTGDLIGLSDNTGFSTGPHLHFGLKLVVNGEVINRDNGFDGAIDPTPYLVWYDSPEIMTEQDVRGLQALEGYTDEAGVAYWTGKALDEYLKARLADKEAQIKKLISP